MVIIPAKNFLRNYSAIGPAKSLISPQSKRNRGKIIYLSGIAVQPIKPKVWIPPNLCIIKDIMAMKILLVDDDHKIHLVVKMWLNRNGHVVESAYNGQEALERLKNEVFQGLITDVNMPLMKGVDLVNAIQQLPNKPQMIVLLTSRCDINQMREQLESTDVHLLNKPFSPAVLAELFENISEAKVTD